MQRTITAEDIHKSDYSAAGRFSFARIPEGDPVYIAGQTALNGSGDPVYVDDLVGQYRQVLENLRAVLDVVGGSLGNLTDTTTYVTDMDAWREGDVAAVRENHLEEPYPCNTLVEVSQLAHPDLLVEVDAVAHI